MKRMRVTIIRISICITGLSLILVPVIFSGCSVGNSGYSKESAVLFERIPEKNVSISDVHAYEDGNTLVILGKVKRSAGNCCDTTKGHIDIALVAGDGTILDLTSVSYSPRNIPKTGTRSSHFTARLPYTLPEDVHLRLRYHRNEDTAAFVKGADTMLCRENVAAAQSEI